MRLRQLIPGLLLFVAFAYVITFHIDWLLAFGSWVMDNTVARVFD